MGGYGASPRSYCTKWLGWNSSFRSSAHTHFATEQCGAPLTSHSAAGELESLASQRLPPAELSDEGAVLFSQQQMRQQLSPASHGPSQMGTTRPHMSAPCSGSASQWMERRMSSPKVSQPLSFQALNPLASPKQSGLGRGSSLWLGLWGKAPAELCETVVCAVSRGLRKVKTVPQSLIDRVGE